MRKLGIGLTLLALAALDTAQARVTRIVVEDRVTVADGTSWGEAGPYERLKGTAYMEVDPRDPLNAGIVNLDRAPQNVRGKVEYSTQFLILKPIEMERGNRKIWYGMNNRGNCIELAWRAYPIPLTTCSPLSATDLGNNLLLQDGYVFVDAGWHGDGIPTPTQLFATFPVAKQADGSPIVGPLRLEYQVATTTFTQPLAPGWRAYPAADTDTMRATLTVRNRADAPKQAIAADRWAFGQCPTGQASLVPTATDLCLFDGFTAGRIYELIYEARDPIVMGLAYAVTRDLASFLRYETADDVGNPNPIAMSRRDTGIRRAYSSGTSSTGMYQRDFLYNGFNEDESHRKVFDGATIYSAATHKLFANVQFAHPTYYSGQDQHHDYTSNSIPPFTFAVTRDPVSGITDGILKRPNFDPMVIQADEELVFWQWKASLNVVDSAGNPLPTPDNVRLYFQNGWGHISAAGLRANPGFSLTCENPTNNAGATGAVTARALVRVMDDWVDKGIAPPPNNYPRKRDMVTLAQYRAMFPKIPDLAPPTVYNHLTELDFGPMFTREGGIQTTLPPVHGQAYDVLLPAPRRDGDGVKGIDTIFTRAPLGTNVGWNVRTGFREPDLCALSGSYVPFAKTAADRRASGDSRPSLEERYANRGGYVDAVKKATRELVRERFMVEEDARLFVESARTWELPLP